MLTFTPTAGNYAFVKADPGNLIAEMDESNNVAVAEIAQPVNRAPTADAGADQTVHPGDTVTLDGSGSTDPDGDALVYRWTQTGGAAVTFTPNLSVTTFTAPTQTGALTFTLTVTDTGGLSHADSVVITVAPHRIYLPLVLRQS